MRGSRDAVSAGAAQAFWNDLRAADEVGSPMKA
ncbi:hypothetical protein SCE1572_00835 [Sorangium cellulosum So0157-2]|uniref:Uncharacterized protein n=1 Tax=Sorangium cellulosum So0157-2 TaxID=1254432 RepID=S4XJ36_SORCE|nr:hypothetical protein SCE1572_00835 [Sorangium cellulosum So0157-2]